MIHDLGLVVLGVTAGAFGALSYVTANVLKRTEDARRDKHS